MIAKTLLFFTLLGLSITAKIKRQKREPYDLPDGVEFYLGDIRTTFQCPGAGFYADLDNNCQLFHVCTNFEFPDGRKELVQHTFACGNQTVFNQYSLTCAHESEAIPCTSSPDFYYLNDAIGIPDQPLHRQEDVDRASLYFGQRI